MTREEVLSWKPGEVILLSGKLLTGRDAAHKRMIEMLNRGEKLPVDFTNRFIYYVGPVDPVRDEAVGPAGPTTSTRMDKFTRQMLEQTGLLGMVGKAERGPAAIQAIKDNKAVYLMAVGGAAYLVSKAIKKSTTLAFADLGMEAIYEFEVEDMPVTVAVDSNGTAVHETGPREWKQRIAETGYSQASLGATMAEPSRLRRLLLFTFPWQPQLRPSRRNCSPAPPLPPGFVRLVQRVFRDVFVDGIARSARFSDWRDRPELLLARGR